jgi:hypothetical protein
LLHAAAADLAGSYALYVDELTSELESGNRVLGSVATFAGRRAYEIRLSQHRPRAALFVDSRTLEPIGASFESATLTGRAVLFPSVPRGTATAC